MSLEDSNKSESISRCGWLNKDPLYIKYHDEEWGKAEHNNLRMFEMLCLEGQQAGLSWITILKKRKNYRKLFFDFDPHAISKLTNNDVLTLIKDSSIVRHKGKIEAIINNAKCFLKMQQDYGEEFSDFVWSFAGYKPIVNNWNGEDQVPSESDVSISLSKALKKRGFKYVGSKICYAFMQACGLVDDHLITCVCRTSMSYPRRKRQKIR